MVESVDEKEQEIVDFPNVRFCVDEDVETRKLNSFLSENKSRGGANLTDILLQAHPGLRSAIELNPDERLSAVAIYVQGYYGENRPQMEDAARTMKCEWDEYSPCFFEVVGRIFKEMHWPEGEYVGYVSISPPYPRYLDSKTFQLPYESVRRGIRVTAHEMLHFMFYEYVRRRYIPDLSNTDEREMEKVLDGRFKIPLWELSEIFNIVVLSGDEFGRGKAKQGASSYTHLADYCEEFEVLWRKSKKDLDKFFEMIEVFAH